MPIFEYTALDSAGKQTRGTLDAENSRAARQKLRSQGLFPSEVKESAVTRKTASLDINKLLHTDRIPIANLAVGTRQLATLVAAGLPLVSALSALADQVESMPLRRTIIDIREKVEEGSTFAKALGNFPKVFPKLYVNMVASGEASGTLDTVLQNLAEYLEAQLELRRKVSAALLYPAIMLVICTLVVIVLVVFVVPRIVEIFEKQGVALPLPTRILMGLAYFVIDWWYLLLLAGLAAFYGSVWYYKQAAGRERIDKALLKVPLFGPLFVKISTARVAHTLGALLSSGVGLLTGLEITRNIVSNVHIVRALDNAQEGVREGRSLAKELHKSGIFPPMLWHMIAVGERSGELESMLGKAGKAYESEVNASLSGLTRLIEPLMMIGVGGVVLCIVISVLLPMAELINVVQK